MYLLINPFLWYTMENPTYPFFHLSIHTSLIVSLVRNPPSRPCPQNRSSEDSDSILPGNRARYLLKEFQIPYQLKHQR